jgi:hypothetical protein
MTSAGTPDCSSSSSTSMCRSPIDLLLKPSARLAAMLPRPTAPARLSDDVRVST